ncbi:MAG: uracil-DNA glycosylase family protein [Acidimicrobiia bacterium]|nr:uracil-DNA glycosylase family protein [Acidimicrobiia bacterium]
MKEEKAFSAIRKEIIAHKSNQQFTKNDYKPLYLASSSSKVVIIGQAPGFKAQESGIPWDDASGERLISWLGVSEKQFRDPEIFALIPMDFYYPGKSKSGDMPPRKDFASLWHRRLLDLMINVKLTVLIGSYAQKYYLDDKKKNLTQTVQNYKEYLPKYFPIVHPSPLNFRWHAKNRWFESEVVPDLQKTIAKIL